MGLHNSKFIRTFALDLRNELKSTTYGHDSQN